MVSVPVMLQEIQSASPPTKASICLSRQGGRFGLLIPIQFTQDGICNEGCVWRYGEEDMSVLLWMWVFIKCERVELKSSVLFVEF